MTPWILTWSSTWSRYDTDAVCCACAITERIVGLKLRIASASGSVRSGLARTRSMSSSVRVIGTRWIVNASAPTSVTMAFDTIAFMP